MRFPDEDESWQPPRRGALFGHRIGQIIRKDVRETIGSGRL
jgi:hypothetical protein